MDDKEKNKPRANERPSPEIDDAPAEEMEQRNEHGGSKGPEPTRYGDWERNGRCYDF